MRRYLSRPRAYSDADYLSDRVYTGVRPVSPALVAALRAKSELDSVGFTRLKDQHGD